MSIIFFPERARFLILHLLLVWSLSSYDTCCLAFGFSMPLSETYNNKVSSSSSLSVASMTNSPPSPPSTTTIAKKVIKRKFDGYTELTTKSEFLSFIDDKYDDDNEAENEFQVIKYHASYCKVCQRIRPIYQRTALACSSDNNNMQFGSVEVSVINGDSTNSSVLKSLGITKLPFIQIYRNKKHCVASFSTGGQSYNFKKIIQSTIDSCQQRDDWDDFLTTYQDDIQNQHNGVEDLWKTI